MGKRKGLKIDGVLMLDKPKGLTSNAALQKARRILNAQKAGHTGTLDPMATGLLPLCFGEATKFSADLLHADKEYCATLKFGQNTDTADAEGEVTQERPITHTNEDLEAALEAFRGEIEQIPPMYSAIKKDGVALYKLARAGEIIEREPRKVVISRLELLEQNNDSITIQVSCSKGTYIRVLAEDIGERLGCGAHLTQLRRVRVGDIQIGKTLTLESLEAMTPQERINELQPVDFLIASLPTIQLDEQLSERFMHGQRFTVFSKEVGRVRVYGQKELGTRLLGTGQLSSDSLLSPERLISNID